MRRAHGQDGTSTKGIGRRRPGLLLAAVGVIGAFTLLGTSAVAATAGWLGEAKLSSSATGDGWEPSIAADPSTPYV